MQVLLATVFRRLVRQGRLIVLWPDGATSSYGDGTGARITIRVRDSVTVRRLLLNPALAVGEAYMDGGLEPVGCSIRDVLGLLIVNLSAGGEPPLYGINIRRRMLLRRLGAGNSERRARRNVAHHYDLDHRLYSLFLDRDLQYSCAYFAEGGETLEQAQAAKKRHIAAKLRLDRPGLRVLDIGCGWGGMALTLARDYGARVTGITLSEEQLAVAKARAAAEGLSDRVSFLLADYRTIDTSFDRIVSVGMFEHVGIGHYDAFFETVRRCLSADGTALLHAIGNSGQPSVTNPWLEKYIFPGGYSPSLSEVFPPIERSGLIATDMEILRPHYAETLLHWQERFARNRDRIRALYDERFCRMFEFYLAGCEFAFRYQGEMVFQIQLVRREASFMRNRSYMWEQERLPELAAAD